jgi:hypothetical protein
MELTLLQMSSEILLEVPGYTPSPEANERYSRNSVTPGYLEMFGVPLLQGRTLSEADGEGAPRVAVINQAFAERFWPGEEVLGRTFFMTLGDRFSEETVGAEARSFEVVGVVRDGKYFDFDDRPTPYFWTSLYQDYSPRITVTARGVASAAAMIPVLREAIDLAPGEVQMMPPSSLATQLSYQFIHLRVASRVLRWGGIFGLFLAIIGIYGVVSFAVTQRTRDMAIRMAIGAQHNQVLGGVVRDGMRPAVLGLLLGAVLAFLAARAVSVILVGVSPLDPAAFAGGIGLLVTAALVASYVPARRALRIDPMRTLREE